MVSAANATANATCLADKSLKSYSSAWNSFVHCSQVFGFSPHMRHTTRIPYSIEEGVQVIKKYIGFECGVRQLNPDSIKGVYIPGIIKTLHRQEIFGYFVESFHHPQVRCILDGYIRNWAWHHPHSARIKLPFTLNLAIATERLLFQGTIRPLRSPTHSADARPTMERFRLTTALWFGIYFLLRKSEFLTTSTVPNQHTVPFTRASLRFQTQNRTDIAYADIGTIKAHFVSITIPFSKTDQSGHGRILHHSIHPSKPKRCIVRRLEKYISVTRDTYGAAISDHLFAIPSFLPLSADQITRAMRNACTIYGMPETSISAHSMRYGGASMLAAAGFPDYIIAYYGGWAPGSQAMRTYIQPSDTLIQTVSGHMGSMQSSTSVEAVIRGLMANRTVSRRT